jgi:hypothetical protein
VTGLREHGLAARGPDGIGHGLRVGRYDHPIADAECAYALEHPDNEWLASEVAQWLVGESRRA